MRIAIFSIAAAMSFAHDAHAGAARDDVDAALAALVAGEEGRVAGVALAVMRDDEIVFAGGAGCAEFQERSGAQTCARAFAADAAVRVASISKMVLALGLFTLVEEGRLDLNADASTYLGRPFRNPHYPDDRISVSSLLSHTASVRDPEEYWAAAPGSLWSLFQGEAAFASPAADGGSRAPGAYYKYANLNSSVLATVIERASGERFDRFMARRVLEPAELDAGYNWSGVSEATRRNGAALYRWDTDAGRWRATVDEMEMRLTEPAYFLTADGLDRASYLNGYQAGDNATLFSPQGGLRASTIDLARLAALAAVEPRMAQPVWRAASPRTASPTSPQGDAEGGWFEGYGLGAQFIWTAPFLRDGDYLLGHAGEAYGLYSGAWTLVGGDHAAAPGRLSFAFVVTGTDETAAARAPNAPSFTRVEARLAALAISFARSALE